MVAHFHVKHALNRMYITTHIADNKGHIPIWETFIWIPNKIIYQCINLSHPDGTDLKMKAVAANIMKISNQQIVV